MQKLNVIFPSTSCFDCCIRHATTALFCPTLVVVVVSGHSCMLLMHWVPTDAASPDLCTLH